MPCVRLKEVIISTTAHSLFSKILKIKYVNLKERAVALCLHIFLLLKVAQCYFLSVKNAIYPSKTVNVMPTQQSKERSFLAAMYLTLVLFESEEHAGFGSNQFLIFMFHI